MPPPEEALMGSDQKFLGIGAVLVGIVVLSRPEPCAAWMLAAILVVGLAVAARATRD